MGRKEIYFAGGCFWGTEKVFQSLNGVLETKVGRQTRHIEYATLIKQIEQITEAN